jgi:hypothetical protein
MSADQIETFIQHFQRITQNCLDQLPSKVHILFHLDSNRQPTLMQTPVPLN